MTSLNANDPDVQRAIGTIVLSAKNNRDFRATWLDDPVAAIQSLNLPDQIKTDLCANITAADVDSAVSLAMRSLCRRFKNGVDDFEPGTRGPPRNTRGALPERRQQ